MQEGREKCAPLHFSLPSCMGWHCPGHHLHSTHPTAMHPLAQFRFCPVCGSAHFESSSPKSNRCGDCGFEYFLNPSAATAAFIVDPQGRLLVLTRRKSPAQGTLDLPGGFVDIGETAEQAIVREIAEETGLRADTATYLFSLPNSYRYSGFEVPTLDSFFCCHVADTTHAHAMDDAADCHWLPLDAIDPARFGLDSIRKGVERFLHNHR